MPTRRTFPLTHAVFRTSRVDSNHKLATWMVYVERREFKPAG